MLPVLTTTAGLCLDIGTKMAAAANLTPGRQVPVVGDYVSFLLVFNRNAIFGLDPRRLAPWLPLNAVFYVFSVIAMVILIVYFSRIPVGDRLMRWGLALIMPGALGNFWDRALYPKRGVVDFIRLGISPEIYWPIFNCADAYVTVGVALILFCVYRDERARKKGQDGAAAD